MLFVVTITEMPLPMYTAIVCEKGKSPCRRKNNYFSAWPILLSLHASVRDKRTPAITLCISLFIRATHDNNNNNNSAFTVPATSNKGVDLDAGGSSNAAGATASIGDCEQISTNVVRDEFRFFFIMSLHSWLNATHIRAFEG